MARTVDLVVIGTGAAGATVASRCRAAGWTVAIIDHRPFGGTCALRGCDPKKVLVGAAAAVNAGHGLAGQGVRAGGIAVDWSELMRFKRTFTDPTPASRLAALRRAGIETFAGVATFVTPTQVAVDGESSERLEASRAIVVAVGARPADLLTDGREQMVTSEQFLDLPSLPSSVVFVGGGYISFEFAHVAARAGARVTILHRGARPLERFEPDLVGRLVERTRDLGIDVRLGAAVHRVEARGALRRVSWSGAGGASTVDAELVVHGAGRAPELDDLNLEAGNVRFSARGVTVDEYLRSVSNPLVHAAGDCADTGAPPLTPVAGYEGRLVAANLLDGRRHPANPGVVPSVVFTLPPLARVGAGEEQARAQGLRFRIRQGDMSGWYSSRRVGEPCAAFKVLVEEETDRIIGAHLLGPMADETINLFALAMRAGIGAGAFKETLWAYPTHASDTAYMV